MAIKDLAALASNEDSVEIPAEKYYYAKLSKRRDLRLKSHSAQATIRSNIFRLNMLGRERIPGHGVAIVAVELDEVIPRKFKDMRFSFRWFVPEAVKVYSVPGQDFEEVCCTNYLVFKLINTNATDMSIDADEVFGMVIMDRVPK